MMSAEPIKPILDSLSKSVVSTLSRGMNKISDGLAVRISSVFPLQGARGGNPVWIKTGGFGLSLRATWPWNASRQKKTAYRMRAKTLMDTGALSKSIKRLGRNQSESSIEVSIGADVPYKNLDKLEEGGTVLAISRNPNKLKGTIDLPPRPIVYVTKEDEAFALRGLNNLDFAGDWK